jgi:hypothetical protein
MPPPPGSWRGAEQRSFENGASFGIDAETSMAGFGVSVMIWIKDMTFEYWLLSELPFAHTVHP